MPPSQPYSVLELQQAVLDGAFGPRPQELAVTSAFWLQHTTRLAGSQVTYRNSYLLMRSADASGHTLDTLIRHESAPVRPPCRGLQIAWRSAGSPAAVSGWRGGRGAGGSRRVEGFGEQHEVACGPGADRRHHVHRDPVLPWQRLRRTASTHWKAGMTSLMNSSRDLRFSSCDRPVSIQKLYSSTPSSS